MAVGRLKEAWVDEGCAEYAKRVRAKLPLSVTEVRDDAELTRKLPSRYQVWALDEHGQELTSAGLAEALARLMNSGEQGLALLVGGADGLSPPLVERADFVWSLGRLTLPHRLARLIVLEQLYRALSIVRGEPYHRP